MKQVILEKTQEYLIVKIPLKSVKTGKAEISSKNQRVVDEAIAEGLHDIKRGHIFGPFKSVREFRADLRKSE
ncbi:MAG: hypothetical protein AAB338_01595 [Patescibacteria group bacterium]